MIRVPEGESKLSAKFVGQSQVMKHLGGHKFELWFFEIVHANRFILLLLLFVIYGLLHL